MAFSDKETQLALRAVLQTVPGLPPAQHRVWDNTWVVDPATNQMVPYKPTVNVPYLTEQYTRQPSRKITNRQTEHRGIYYATMFGITGSGTAAIRTVTDAILAAFPAMQGFVMASGNVVRVRGDLAPYPGQIIDLDEGKHSYSQVAIPWFVIAPT